MKLWPYYTCSTVACRTENARRNTVASLARGHDIFLPWSVGLFAVTGLDDRAWYYAAFALSVLNLALWSYNLFVFLLLRVLPIYFDKIKTPPVDMAYTVVPIPKTNAN